jgi:hypothetical protein
MIVLTPFTVLMATVRNLPPVAEAILEGRIHHREGPKELTLYQSGHMLSDSAKAPTSSIVAGSSAWD